MTEMFDKHNPLTRYMFKLLGDIIHIKYKYKIDF